MAFSICIRLKAMNSGDLAAGILGEGRPVLERRRGARGLPGGGLLGGFLEEMAHGQLEDLQDLEESVESDLVLTVLHPREVGLCDADARREIRLGQPPALPDLPDLLPHEEDLGRTRHGTHER